MEENLKTFQIRLRENGELSISRSALEAIDAAEGDILTLYQVNDLILLTPRKTRVAELSDQMIEVMDRDGVSLESLLEGLEEVREQIAEERQAGN